MFLFNYIIWMQKISLEEEVDMSTCNLSKIIHNIRLQQSRKKGPCLYVTTSNDYTWTLKHSTLYYAFLHGGPSTTRLEKDELWLYMAN